MTMPDERKRSLKYTRDFLRSLLNPKSTPKVPKAVRDQAYRVLKHYPGNYELDQLSKKCPDILGD